MNTSGVGEKKTIWQQYEELNWIDPIFCCLFPQLHDKSAYGQNEDVPLGGRTTYYIQFRTYRAAVPSEPIRAETVTSMTPDDSWKQVYKNQTHHFFIYLITFGKKKKKSSNVKAKKDSKFASIVVKQWGADISGLGGCANKFRGSGGE